MTAPDDDSRSVDEPVMSSPVLQELSRPATESRRRNLEVHDIAQEVVSAAAAARGKPP